MPVLKHRKDENSPWEVVGVTQQASGGIVISEERPEGATIWLDPLREVWNYIDPETGEVVTMGTPKPLASIFVKGLSENDTVTATKDGITRNGVWVQRINRTDVKIPTMTSNIAPSGVASASSVDTSSTSTNFAAYNAFTGLSSNGWRPSSNDAFEQAYLQYEFEEPIVPNKIRIATIRLSNGITFTYKVIASQDLQSWDTLIESITTTDMGAFHDTVINVTESYKYFRLVLLATSGASISSSNGHKMQIHGTKVETVCGHEITKIKDLGTWTVTATNGEKTATQDVLIEDFEEYEIEMDLFKLWLYSEGDECEDVTGGWRCWKDSGTAEFLDTSIHFGSGANDQTQRSASVEKINVTQYSKLCAEVEIKSQSSSQYCNLWVGLAETVSTDNIQVTRVVQDTAQDVGKYTLCCDISELTGEYYVAAGGYYLGNGYIYNVWLE